MELHRSYQQLTETCCALRLPIFFKRAALSRPSAWMFAAFKAHFNFVYRTRLGPTGLSWLFSRPVPQHLAYSAPASVMRVFPEVSLSNLTLGSMSLDLLKRISYLRTRTVDMMPTARGHVR